MWDNMAGKFPRCSASLAIDDALFGKQALNEFLGVAGENARNGATVYISDIASTSHVTMTSSGNVISDRTR
jgi:hypothetical protein